MPRFHEEWLGEIVLTLGKVAEGFSDLGDGPTLRRHLSRLKELAEAWNEWAIATDVDQRIAIEEKVGL